MIPVFFPAFSQSIGNLYVLSRRKKHEKDDRSGNYSGVGHGVYCLQQGCRTGNHCSLYRCHHRPCGNRRCRASCSDQLDHECSTWSSPNGATIHITATPNQYAEGQKADFVVRLEGDEVIMVPCQWDGTAYSASADLNAENGYCYYILLTDAGGAVTEVAVNTPAEPINEAYINLEAALLSYCSISVEESKCENNTLTLSTGKVQVQVPAISDSAEAVTCQEAALVLSYNGQELEKKALTLAATDAATLYEADLSGITFTLPEMKDEEKVELTLTAALSNGQILSAYGGNWIYGAEEILPVVG